MKYYFHKFKCTYVPNISQADLKKNELAAIYLKYLENSEIRPQFIFNPKIDSFLLIWRLPFHDRRRDLHTNQGTFPLFFILTQQELAIFSFEDSEEVDNIIRKQLYTLQRKKNKTTTFLLLRLLWVLNEYFITEIDLQNRTRTKLETFRKSPSRVQIKKLSNLSRSLIYLVTAANNNLVAVQQLKLNSGSLSKFLPLNALEKDYLKDVVSETQQCQQVANLATQLAQEITDSYNNILNNSLSDALTLLTILSVVIGLPSLTFGFFGMKIYIPFEGSQTAWIFVLISTLFLSLLIIFWIRWYVKK